MNKQVPISLRLNPDSKTGHVWAIADRITQQTGRRASRTEVVNAFVREGGNGNTASTQYSHWKAAYDQRSASPEQKAPQSSARVSLQIGGDGRLLVPLELRSQMLIGEDGRVSAWVEDGELKVISPQCALLRLQKMVRDADQGEGSPVDELISERRSEAKRG